MLDCCAGTGIATRQLTARGTRTIALDIGELMLRQALARTPGTWCVLADCHALPVRSGAADLAAFAQSWHWLDQPCAIAEVARVLRPGGYWAAWWSQPAAHDEPWFAEYQDVMQASCPRYYREHAAADGGAGDEREITGPFEPAVRVVMPWTRTVTAEDWITEERSKSYVIDLAPQAREALLARVTSLIRRRFPNGRLVPRYRTGMWLARRA